MQGNIPFRVRIKLRNTPFLNNKFTLNQIFEPYFCAEEVVLDGYKFYHAQGCIGRDEIFNGTFDESDIDECKSICDLDDTCVSFEYWGETNSDEVYEEGHCQVSSTCTSALSEDSSVTGLTCNLYVKGESEEEDDDSDDSEEEDNEDASEEEDGDSNDSEEEEVEDASEEEDGDSNDSDEENDDDDSDDEGQDDDLETEDEVEGKYFFFVLSLKNSIKDVCNDMAE